MGSKCSFLPANLGKKQSSRVFPEETVGEAKAFLCAKPKDKTK